MPREPREPRTDIDKHVDSIIHDVCVSLFEHIDGLPDERSVPPSRSDLWVSLYRNELCAMVRERIVTNAVKTMLVTDPHVIILDREIIRVWLTIRKNPEAHGVQKR